MYIVGYKYMSVDVLVFVCLTFGSWMVFAFSNICTMYELCAVVNDIQYPIPISNIMQNKTEASKRTNTVYIGFPIAENDYIILSWGIQHTKRYTILFNAMWYVWVKMRPIRMHIWTQMFRELNFHEYSISKIHHENASERKNERENIQILTFVKLGTNKWVVIDSLLFFGNDWDRCCCDGPAVVTFETLLESLFVSIASINVDSKTGTSLKLCGFSMVNPDRRRRTIELVVYLRLLSFEFMDFIKWHDICKFFKIKMASIRFKLTFCFNPKTKFRTIRIILFQSIQCF